jgi:cystathionine beta-lyase/cystathionine gamma-synthase
MSHGGVSENIKTDLGITTSLIIFSVISEDKEDILDDIKNAIKIAKE